MQPCGDLRRMVVPEGWVRSEILVLGRRACLLTSPIISSYLLMQLGGRGVQGWEGLELEK